MDNIVIITNKPFPEGFASTVRFTTYSRGMIEYGCNIFIHIIFPSEDKNNVKNERIEGHYKGLSFEYTGGSVIRPSSLLFRALKKKWGLYKSLIKIRELNKKSSIKSIILIGRFGLFIELCYFLLSKIEGITLIQERSEFAFIGSKNSILKKINTWIYLRLNCKLYNAMFVISKPLSEYYQQYLSKKAKLFIMPIVVDPKRFEIGAKKTKSSEYIAYCGSMESDKDGIEYLIEAFSIISTKHSELTLKLIGKTDFPKFKKLQNLIVDLGVTNRIEFTGRVTNEEMAILLINAKILALSRPQNSQTEGNFPTKLGEYLATGNPIVTTKVGIVEDYLIHKKNAYLAKPSDSGDFAENLLDALDNYQEAIIIGREGKKLADKTFNYAYLGKELLNFINSIKHD